MSKELIGSMIIRWIEHSCRYIWRIKRHEYSHVYLHLYVHIHAYFWELNKIYQNILHTIIVLSALPPLCQKDQLEITWSWKNPSKRGHPKKNHSACNDEKPQRVVWGFSAQLSAGGVRVQKRRACAIGTWRERQDFWGGGRGRGMFFWHLSAAAVYWFIVVMTLQEGKTQQSWAKFYVQLWCQGLAKNWCWNMQAKDVFIIFVNYFGFTNKGNVRQVCFC